MPFKHFIGTLDDHVTPDQAQLKYAEYIRQAAGLPRPSAGGGGAPPASVSAVGAVRQELPLPDKIVSGIIGKSGIVIKEIVARSGAKIQVSQKAPENLGGERVVTMSGTADQVAMAQHMISERCKAIEAQLTSQAAAPQSGYAAVHPSGHQAHQGYPPEQQLAQGYGAAAPNPAGAIGADANGYMGAVYAPPPLFGQPHW